MSFRWLVAQMNFKGVPDGSVGTRMLTRRTECQKHSCEAEERGGQEISRIDREQTDSGEHHEQCAEPA